MRTPPRPTVAEVASEAVRTGSRATLLDAFVLAARECAEQERRGDVRDGLIDMPLPFRAAEKLLLDVDALVTDSLARLDGRSAGLLREFAARPDRGDVEAMGWDERLRDGVFAFGSGTA